MGFMQAHVCISGFVQGVGYRQFLRHSARQNSVSGWVKNLPDGRVEAILQGSRSQSSGQAKKAIERVINACRKGPFLSEVENVEVVWEDKEEEYTEFMILPS